MDYDEPEPLPFAARHWLGAALIEAGQLEEAEEVYRIELEDHRHSGRSGGIASVTTEHRQRHHDRERQGSHGPETRRPGESVTIVTTERSVRRSGTSAAGCQ